MNKSKPILSTVITSAFSPNKIKVLNTCYSSNFFPQNKFAQQKCTYSPNGFNVTFKPRFANANATTFDKQQNRIFNLPQLGRSPDSNLEVMKSQSKVQSQDFFAKTAKFVNLNTTQSLNLASKIKDPKNKPPSIKANHDSLLDLQHFINNKIYYKNKWQELKSTIHSQKQNNLLKSVRNKIHLVNRH